MFGSSTINSVNDELKDLIRLQKGVISAVSSEKDSLDSDRNSAVKAIGSAAVTLVPVGNDARFAELTEVAKAAGTGDDFAALVKQWREEDIANRTERATLEKDWGSRTAVAEKIQVQKEELDIIKDALSDVSPEIEAFDVTQAAIEAHNAKYPKAPITEENHDGFEVFKLGRFLLWLTFLNRGPHKAYQIIRPYNDKYGDFYEDMRDIAKLRQNEEELKESRDSKQAAYDEICAVASRMDTLDGSYKGAEGIARGVRSIVVDRVRNNPSFGLSLSARIDTPETANMVLCARKVLAYDQLANIIDVIAAGAKNTLERLDRVTDKLDSVAYTVGGRSIYYDTTSDERAVESGIEATRTALRGVERSRDAIDEMRITGNAELTQAEMRISDLTAQKRVQNEIRLDFSNLERLVSNEVAAYEEEERRRREAARRAREQQEAAARAARDLARSVSERRNSNITGGFNNAGISRPSHHSSIGGGSSGISRSGGHSIKGGGRGINR